jgi:hypothetical protein
MIPLAAFFGLAILAQMSQKRIWNGSLLTTEELKVCAYCTIGKRVSHDMRIPLSFLLFLEFSDFLSVDDCATDFARL